MNEKNWLWIGALGIVAIIVIVIVVIAVRGSSQVPQTPITQTSPAAQTQVLSNTVSASNQPAGQSVKIDSVSLKEAGYVVIHEEAEGKPAKVIGNSSALQAGTYSNLVVNLTRASKDGENLYPMLHSDDGDGTYGFPDEDLPIKDEQGNIVIAKLTVGGASSQTSGVTITYDGSAFSSAQATVASGGKVTWVNSSGKQLQLGSDPHPIHTGNKEVSGGKFTLDIAPGQSAAVTVTKTGTFGYHDHLNPSAKGKLVVQ